jgi:uncharacterized protein YbjT (DUF2867 family)
MKIFVTGATGFVGQGIVRHLHEAGHSIRILARDPQSPPVQALTKRYGVEAQKGNLLDSEALAKGVAGMNAVIHLVGIISEIGENTFHNVHTVGTQIILAEVQRARVERYIHMSALGTRPNSHSRYHQSKWQAEEAVRRSDLDYTIFRPSVIYGPGDEFINLFSRIIRLSPIVPIMANEQARFQPIALDQVATAFARSVMEPKSIGEVYDLCGPDQLTLEQIVNAICLAMGRRRIKLRIPLSISQKLAGALEFIFPRLLKRAPPLNRDQLIMLQEDNTGNPDPANHLFNLQPTSFAEGLSRALMQTGKG